MSDRPVGQGPRPRNDLGRQLDSVLKPRENLPGSRRARFLIVFGAFLLVEAAFVVVSTAGGQVNRVALVLWGAWLVACVAWVFLPVLARNDAPAHQRVARLVWIGLLAAGLLVTGGARLIGVELAAWWMIAVVSVCVAGCAIVLGVLEWRADD